MTHPDTDPNNPVSSYPQNLFPVGAVLTVAYGSNERIFCTLGNLYRILGYLTGDVPTADTNDADGVDSIDEAIERCRQHVIGQVDGLDQIKPTRATSDTGILKWIAEAEAKLGATVRLDPLPGVVRR